MNHMKVLKQARWLGLTIFLLPNLIFSASTNESIYLIEKGPLQKSTLYADGSTVDLQTEIITLPMINSDLTNITVDEFRNMVMKGRQAFESNLNKKIISRDGQREGLNIVFVVTNSPGPQADTALERAAQYIEGVFGDPITVTIDVNFASLSPGVLGWTSVVYAGYSTWTNTRTALINGRDSDDTIEVWLPSGATIPVRYDGSSSTVTNETQCRFVRANYNAVIGTQAGDAASMEFNTDFTWDYDPSNGITGGTICFQSVAIHEVGHVLGFTSRAESWYQPNTDIDALDIYRFQNTDGTGDYNPDTYAEFQATARLVDYNNPNNDHNSDIIAAEYRMEDGSPNQASHFLAGIGALMDPNLAYGETFYPDFYRTADKAMFDAVGWDYPPVPYYVLNISTVGSGSVTKDPNLSSYPESTEVQLTAVPNLGWSFDHWSGDLAGSANPDTILMDSDKSVTAHFTQNQYTLTIIIVGNGQVTKNPNQSYYVYGDQVTLTANPDVGWSFDHWEGDLTGSQNPDTILINGNETVTAYFTENQYTLTVNIYGSGSVTKDPNQPYYLHYDTVEVLANPDAGWSFDHWSGDLTGSANPETLIMNSSKTINAYFTPNQCTLTVNISGNGTVLKDPNQTVFGYGEEVELTAVPDSGWYFDHWSGDLTGSANPDTLLMDSDKSVTAHFTQNQYTLTVNIVGNGQVTKNPDQTYYVFGDEVELLATADSGWIFDHWSGDLLGNANPDTITIDDNKTVTAHFLEEQAVEELTNDLGFETSLDVLPNPFRDHVSIILTLSPNAHNLQLRIFDISGCLVKEFMTNGLTTSSVNQIVWEGKDEVGRRLPEGVYFMKFDCHEFRTIRKLLLMR